MSNVAPLSENQRAKPFDFYQDGCWPSSWLFLP